MGRKWEDGWAGVKEALRAKKSGPFDVIQRLGDLGKFPAAHAPRLLPEHYVEGYLRWDLPVLCSRGASLEALKSNLQPICCASPLLYWPENFGDT